MQERVTTSFIPKDSLSSERAPLKTSKGNPFVLLNIIAGVILIAAVVAAAGEFLFYAYTTQNISSKQASLERQRSAFEPATIEELSRLDKRLTAAQKLLKTHVALSLLFNDLESKTGVNLRFKDFSYAAAGPGKMVITMSGSAKSFNAVALESDALGKSTLLKDPIFSNLNIDQTGSVIFNFTAEVDTTRINYATVVASGGAQPPADTTTPPAP